MRTVVILIFFSILAEGCAAPPSKFLRPKVDIRQYKKVAVLPMDNYTDDRLAGEKIRLAIIVELLSSGLDVMEPGEVNSTMMAMNMTNLRALSSDKLKAIGKELKTDLLIVGTVTEYGLKMGTRGSYPEISINLIMFDATSGQDVWSVWHATAGPSVWTNYFGAQGETLNEATRKIVKEAVRSCL